MITVVGVRFKKAGKIYYFDPGTIDVSEGDHVIVETARGVEYGECVIGKRDIPESQIVSPLKPVLRVASEEDDRMHEKNREKAEEAYAVCLEKIKSHGLEMKLIDVEYTFDNNKVIFYFTADGRVDFRELVKDLASIFRTRIELRQIGVRDESKMVKGLGPCGREICCGSWLGDFAPVSIKMAKDQSLSLNPVKISGLCGRLMCCLKYEYDTYVQIRVGMPNRGDKVKTPEGDAYIVDTNILLEQVKVRHILKENPEELSEDLVVYTKEDITILRPNRKRSHDKKDDDEPVDFKALKALED